MTRHAVATVSEIPPGHRKVVRVEGRSIGVFNIGTEFLAIRNRCPHQGAPLCEGEVVGLSRSDGPGEYHLERDGEVIRCPWHLWAFDLRTGRSVFEPDFVRVKSYDVSVETFAATEEGGIVFVEI